MPQKIFQENSLNHIWSFFSTLVIAYFFSANLFSQSRSELDSTAVLEQAKKDISYLCSSELSGRGAIDDGELKAAKWIAKEFEKIGLESYSGGYLQPFQLQSINTFPKKISLKSKRKNFVLGKEYLVSSFSKKGRGKAKVIYLDSTFFENKALQQKWLLTSLKRKAVMYHNRWTEKIQTNFPEFLDKAQEAEAILLRQDKLLGIPSPKAYSIPQFEVLDSIFPKDLTQIKFRVKNKLLENYTSHNVIARVRGKKYPRKAIVFTAHYDHLGKMGKETYFAGANDNAAGVAMLLSLARYYQQNPSDYSIVFMAFGAEEIGLMGSLYYTQHSLFPLSDIEFLVNLDLVGTGEKGATFVNATIFDREFGLIKSINQKHHYLSEVQSRGVATSSDHYFFYKNRVPCFFIYLRGGSQAYHDILDRPDQLSLAGYFGLTNLLIDFEKRLHQ